MYLKDDILIQEKSEKSTTWVDTHRIVKNCSIGSGTRIFHFVNIYECEIGQDCMIGSFVEIQKGAKIGNGVRVQSHSFICDGIEIGNDVFVGHGVVFANDKYPSIESWKNASWSMAKTVVEDGASIGNNVTLLPGIKIGHGALIGAGSVVTKDVPARAKIVGNPGRQI